MEALTNAVTYNISMQSCTAVLFVFLAGVVTSFSPCSLSSIPLIIGYVTNIKDINTKKSLLYSIIFVSGAAVTFIILGLLSALIELAVTLPLKAMYVIIGILMIVTAFQIFEFINIIPSFNLINKSNKRGSIGAFITGILSGFISSPCSTPVLIAILLLIMKEKNLTYGIILMLAYSLGHGALSIITGVWFGAAGQIKSNKKYYKIYSFIKLILGAFALFLGIYLVYQGI